MTVKWLMTASYDEAKTGRKLNIQMLNNEQKTNKKNTRHRLNSTVSAFTF